jgi:hypothetical protein
MSANSDGKLISEDDCVICGKLPAKGSIGERDK